MIDYSELSFEEKSEVFEKTLLLRKSGFGYKRIIKAVSSEFNARLPQNTLVYWLKNNVKLLGGENQFKPESSAEFCYVLGAMFGDACISIDEKKQDYRIRLESIDKDFAEKFSSCVSKILGKSRNYSVCRTARGMYSTQARSRQLYYFIKSTKEDFEIAKQLIEEFPKEFIQGLADSEGCTGISAAKEFSLCVSVAYSANERLLVYVQSLLKDRFGIDSNLRLFKKAGLADSTIDGRLIIRSKNVYCLRIDRIQHVREYTQKIGFSILRKQGKLQDAVELLSCPKESRLLWWHLHYTKNNKEWKKNRSAD